MYTCVNENAIPFYEKIGMKKPDEQARQDAEVQAMHERRGVKMTAGDVRALRLRRVLDGALIKALFDTIRLKGKNWSEIK